ncbi:hypothetical protein ATJ93_0030 [Halopiger aswanensis]|uniref:Small CPxCG-related zinc finger protein n=2 Tax=Halopiger aswanensis TaxID=148449 RepID=A0A419WNM4_9EURY|nr:hypothetical protein ATJ93_0030 [Halopiger aswanensis]
MGLGMSGQKQTTRTTTRSTMRNAVKSVLFSRSSEDATTIEECRRCGKTIESREADCPVCGCGDIVEYRIQ